MNPWLGLAAALAGQLPSLADRLKKSPGSVVRDVGAALNVPPAPGPIEVALASDPEALNKLAAIDLDVFEAEEASRQAARDTWKGTPFLWFAGAFAAGVLILFAVSLYLGATAEVPEANVELYARQQGTLENILLIVVGFIFGSSVGSKLKSGAARPEV